jgi:hypothetical protein
MAMPAVFKELVQQFHLTARPVSKYRLAIPVLGLAHDGVPADPANLEPIALYA